MPKYVLVLPLAWALQAAPSNIAMGHVRDFPLILVGTITVGLIIWRGRTPSWQAVAAGLVLTWMIAWSGHDVELVGTALLLVALTLVQTIWADAQWLHTQRPVPHRVCADVIGSRRPLARPSGQPAQWKTAVSCILPLDAA